MIYKPFEATSTEFVEFWRGVYGDDDTEKLYDDNIGLELTEQRILELFQWKNGSRLSRTNEASVRRNFIHRRRELQQLRPDQRAGDLLALEKLSLGLEPRSCVRSRAPSGIS